MAGQYFSDPRPYYFIKGEQKLAFVDDCFPPKKDPKFIDDFLKCPDVEKKKDDKKPDAPQTQKEEKSKIQTVELSVDLCCDSCERKVTEALENVQGVEKVICDQVNKKVIVKSSLKPEVVLKIVKKVKRNAQLVPEKK